MEINIKVFNDSYSVIDISRAKNDGFDIAVATEKDSIRKGISFEDGIIIYVLWPSEIIDIINEKTDWISIAIGVFLVKTSLYKNVLEKFEELGFEFPFNSNCMEVAP